MPRLFIAIDLPPAHRDRIRSICFGLPGTRWTPAEQIHLTLRFIGEVDGNLFRQITDTLAGIKTEPLTLKIKGLSCGFIKVNKQLALGDVIELKDSRRKLKVRIENDIRPNRTARKPLKDML